MSLKSTPQITKRQVDSAELSVLIRAAINDGHTISIIAPGGSMLPFIRSDDKIFISPVGGKQFRSGDILVFLREPDRRVIAHRAVKINADLVLCKGDNVAEYVDGWIPTQDVLGRVDRVERDGRPIRWGVGPGKRLIAWLSKRNKLVPLVNSIRKVKWGVIKLFSPEDKSKF